MSELIVKLTSDVLGNNINSITELLNIDTEESMDALRKIFAHFRKKNLFSI